MWLLITQQALLDELGKPQSFVAKYENGERWLDVVEFVEITEVLGAETVEIIQSLTQVS